MSLFQYIDLTHPTNTDNLASAWLSARYHSIIPHSKSHPDKEDQLVKALAVASVSSAQAMHILVTGQLSVTSPPSLSAQNDWLLLSHHAALICGSLMIQFRLEQMRLTKRLFGEQSVTSRSSANLSRFRMIKTAWQRLVLPCSVNKHVEESLNIVFLVVMSSSSPVNWPGQWPPTSARGGTWQLS